MSDPGDGIVSLADAGKRFDDSWVLRGIDLSVPEGSIVGLIGPSGCGKTTTVRMINGTYRADEGTVTTLGVDPASLSLRDRQHIGYLPQQPVLFESLTLWENLNFHASLNGMRLRRRARLDEMLDLVELGDERRKRVADASGGMQRRLALAATLAHAPTLAMLDEPTAGIDPILRARFWTYFRDLASEGTTMVVTTQYVGEAAHCDVVGLLADGRLLHFAPPEELRRAAVGGELARVRTDRPLDDAELDEIARIPGVDGDIERESRRTFAAVVADAAAALPLIERWLDDHDAAVVESEHVSVDYDEAFVRLVEAHRESTTEVETDAEPEAVA